MPEGRGRLNEDIFMFYDVFVLLGRYTTLATNQPIKRDTGSRNIARNTILPYQGSYHYLTTQ